MKFGAKLLDIANITHFTNIVATVAKLCAKSTTKTCILKLTNEKMYFIYDSSFTVSSSNGTGKTTFWLCVESKNLFDLYICEGKSKDENFIILEFQPDNFCKALKSTSQNIKNVRIRLSKRQSGPCLTVELDLPSLSVKSNTRTVVHDISVAVIAAKSFSFEEPNLNNANLSITLPPLKLFKHMIERMKCLTEYITLQATQNGDLIFKIETDLVNVSTYFKDQEVFNVNQALDTASVRLSIKKLYEFINSLQFQPTKLLCNFINNKYAHFFVLQNDVILQYVIGTTLN